MAARLDNSQTPSKSRVSADLQKLSSPILARNVPADVERYVKEVKEGNPGYTEEQAWATAWTIYCDNNPESTHCHS